MRQLHRLHWLVIPLGCGLILTLTLIWFTGAQATKVLADLSSAHSKVVLYVSTIGNDVGNDCQFINTPCQTVQHAIQVAQTGDWIHVSGGIYTGTMQDSTLAMGVSATVIITKDISSLLGGYSADFSTRDIEANETVLSAAGSPGAHVVILSNTQVRLGGFTLSGSSGPYSAKGFYYPGGAIRVFGGSPTIRDNTIINNRAYRRGGGIYVGQGASPSILNNRIVSNTIITIEGDTSSDGGGIYVASGPTLIRENVILSNTTQGEGGGIYIGWNVSADIISNTIAYNRIVDPVDGQGAGIQTTGDEITVTIRSNHIYANALMGGFEGSGLYISSPAVIDGNWIEGNFATGGRSALCVADVTVPVTITNNLIAENAGTGMRSFNNHDVRMINNTIARNAFRGIQVLFPESDGTNTARFELQNNIIAGNGECGVFIENRGNQLLDYNDVVGQRYQYCGFPDIQDHNMSVDPEFVDPSSGDYHLLAGSPTINRGDHNIASLNDFDGTWRAHNYTADMGAYEFIYLKVFLPMTRK